MKHKLFNNIYPYVYYIKHIKSGIKYVGVRFANIKQRRSPQNDFLKYYFTSIKSIDFSWFKKCLMSNLSEFEYRIVATFDSKNEAIEYEKKITRKIYGKEGWANQCSGRAIFLSSKKRKEARIKGAKTYHINVENGFHPKFSEYGLARKREIAKVLNEKNKKNPPRLGSILSDETKNKISISNTGKKFPEREGSGNHKFGTGPLYKITSPNGESVLVRGGAGKFLKENHVSERNLYRAKNCKGKVTSRNNWIIEYLSD